MSLCSVSPRPGAADAGALHLLADDQVVAEVVDPAAAVLLGHGHARGTRRRRPSVNSSRGTMPAVLPLEVVRRDLPLDEGAEALAEQVVLVGEERAAHGAEDTPDAARKRRSWDEINRVKERGAVP